MGISIPILSTCDEEFNALREDLARRLRGDDLSCAMEIAQNAYFQISHIGRIGGWQRVHQALRSTLSWCDCDDFGLLFLDSTAKEISAEWERTRAVSGSGRRADFYNKFCQRIVAVASELKLKPSKRKQLVKRVKDLKVRQANYHRQNRNDQENSKLAAQGVPYRKDFARHDRIKATQTRAAIQKKAINELEILVKQFNFVEYLITITLPEEYRPGTPEFVLSGSPTVEEGVSVLHEAMRHCLPRNSADYGGVYGFHTHRDSAAHLHIALAYRNKQIAQKSIARLIEFYKNSNRPIKIIGGFGYVRIPDVEKGIVIKPVSRTPYFARLYPLREAFSPKIDNVISRKKYSFVGLLNENAKFKFQDSVSINNPLAKVFQLHHRVDFQYCSPIPESFTHDKLEIPSDAKSYVVEHNRLKLYKAYGNRYRRKKAPSSEANWYQLCIEVPRPMSLRFFISLPRGPPYIRHRPGFANVHFRD